MKRFLSIFLALVMLLAVMPMGTYAAESKTERDILLEKACAAFPEYASKIAADTAPIATCSAQQERTLVFTDTRALSENDFISYTEYSDGLVLLSDTNLNRKVTYNSNTVTGARTKADITVTATYSGINSYFKVSNVKYTIEEYGVDCITSIGSPKAYPSPNTSYDNCQYHGYTLNQYETDSGNARVAYSLSFRYATIPTAFITSCLAIEVGNNAVSVYHYSTA